MKVLRTIPLFYPIVTGPAKQAYNVAQALNSKGVVSTIFTAALPFGAKIERVNGLLVKRFRKSVGISGYQHFYGLASAIMRENCDIIHAHEYRNYFTDLAFVTANIKKMPFVLQPHGTVFAYQKLKKIKTYFYALHDFVLLKKILHSADAVIASSVQEKNELSHFCKSENLYIIPAGVMQKTTGMQKRDQAGKNILFVGRLSRIRNVEFLIKAIKFAKRLHKDIKLFIVGSEIKQYYSEKAGYFKELQQLVKSLDLEKNVVFTGFLESAELDRYYEIADVFVCPSLYESFGQAILEAASFGIPIISTPVGVAPEIVENYKTGFLIHTADPKTLASKISELLADAPLRFKMGSELKKMVAEKFGWEKIVKLYLELYENISG